MVTIFYLSSKSFAFLKLKHFVWNPLQFHQVIFSNVWDFAQLLSAFVKTNPFFGLGLFWSNVNLFHNLLLIKKDHVITLLFWITSQHWVRFQNSRQRFYFSFHITLISDYKILRQPCKAWKLLKLCLCMFVWLNKLGLTFHILIFNYIIFLLNI
jgi:hypothetical protein